MPQSTRASDPSPYPIRTPILVLAVVVAFAGLLGCSAALASTKTKSVAKTTEISSLGKTVLTTNRGHTLYSLSAETKGKFICTDPGCLATWVPLVVAKGVKPTGPVALGTRMRPDGRVQVTYKGLPLYSFNGDIKKGEANGEGLKDVGTWHVAKVSKISSQPQPQPEPAPSPPPYPYPPVGSY
jgi:predicted lipoprotein with Yx(FWY)xxD motif